MNCQKGDLALVIGGLADNVGKVVRCIELHQSRRLGSLYLDDKVGPVWVVDQDMHWARVDKTESFYMKLQADAYLAPLRGADKDEVIEETKQLHHMA
jgi:hypothetical protein